MKGAAQMIRLAMRLITGILLSPFRLLSSIRGSMTGASVTLLLAGIVSLNIVWGYPWTGMFAACMSLMFVGWCTSRLMRPRLHVGFSLPSSAIAGTDFSLILHLENRSRIPAFDLTIDFHSPSSRKKKTAAGYVGNLHTYVEAILRRELVDLSGSLNFAKRGVHPLPDIEVVSQFPFGMFYSKTRVPIATEIAITPKPLTGNEDALARAIVAAIGGWSHKLLAGNDLDYTGSREYQVGMPVRRWDFSSWARLGRPIVREFQSPSIQSAMLIVDVASDQSVESDGEPLERLLSAAATVVTELQRKLVRTSLFVSCESASLVTAQRANPSHQVDVESVLIRLAQADSVSERVADQELSAVLEHVGHSPILILTNRADAMVWNHVPATATIVATDQISATDEVLRVDSPQSTHRGRTGLLPGSLSATEHSSPSLSPKGH